MPARFDSDMMTILRCPVTKSQLTVAPPSLIDQLNLQIEAGTLVNRVGQTIDIKLDSGFVNQDQSLLLPVRGGIVILVTDQAIGLSGNRI